MRHVASLTSPNHDAYCLAHGYERITRLHQPGDGHPYWARFRLALDALPRYDRVVTLDIDTLFTEPARRLPEPVSDLSFTTDHNGLNCACVFWMNTPWTMAFLARFLDARSYYGDRWVNQEQTAMAYLLYREPKEKWEVLPQRSCNAYLYEAYEGMEGDGNWEQGDLILHLAGLTNERRVQILKRLIAAQSPA